MAQTEKGIIYPYDYNEVADVPSDFKALAESIDRILSDYSLNTDSGNKIVLEMNNTTYKIKAVLKDKDDNVISTSNEIDLPLENMVTNISYNNQILTLTHQDGQTTEVSIADLISDLASKEEVEELQSQVDDLTTLVETELESNEVEGTEIDVSDSAEYRGRIEVKGNTEQKQLSGKNLLPNNLTNYTAQNITYTINDDKNIIVNGTANALSIAILGFKTIPAGTYILSGCPSGGSNTSYRIDLIKDSNSGSVLDNKDTGNGATITLTEDTYLSMRIRITAGTQIENLIFKPMLRLASITDNTYEPYCEGQAAPNPSYEIPIKVVTGDNVVKHVGKNLLNKDDTFTNKYIDDNGVSHTSRVDATFDEYISINQNTDYIYHSNKSVRNLAVSFYDKNKNFIQRNIARNANYLQVTAPNNAKYILLSTSYNATDTVTQEVINNLDLQLEQGSTATPYETHREEEYKLDLWKENEFDKENVLSGYNINETTSKIANVSSSTLVYMSCKPNTTYKISKILSSRFGVGTTREIPAANSTVYNYIRKDGKTEIIIKTGTQDTYIVAWVHTTTYDTEITVQEILDSIQIQEAIEQCKIGDYEDILFKNVVGDENYNAELENGAWYKKNVIDKVVLDGTQNGSVINAGTNNYYYQFMNLTNLSAGEDSNYINCSHYFGIGIYNGNTNQGICVLTSHREIRIRYGTEDTISNFKNKLAENNVILYYVQKTPTYTKITDQTLIAQLEALRKAKWFKGVNHWWTETENLEPNLKGTYKQNNNLRLQALEQAVVALGGV